MKNVEVALNGNEESSQNTNIHFDKTSLSVTDLTFDFGIEEFLREIAMQKRDDPELMGKLVKIEQNATNEEVWETLEENEEIYCLLLENFAEVTNEYFILGFVEAYKMMWKLANNG